jgi:hydrogenase maturation protein HypF
MVALAPGTGTPAIGRLRLRILVRGLVQGVGFRPFVHRQATALGLSGWVANSPEGVAVEAQGNPDAVAALIRGIRRSPPPNAVVDSVETRAIDPGGDTAFVIKASEAAGGRAAQVLPDLATCPDCLAELSDPSDRRHRYPFINCTRCGPRYSIIEGTPYDRARTSMRHFPMCAACRAEYENPGDRRFHAEPNACSACGPRLALWDAAGAVLAREHDALLAAATSVRNGRIVAVKGIGGFHLVADAGNQRALQQLRARKQRIEKPFAVMFPALADVKECCHVSPIEAALLSGPARPIVLLRPMKESLAPAVAPGNPWLGALLPYAPLHHLLMQVLGFPIVVTSGNVADEPIVIDEIEAVDRLAGIADLFLVHDRPIVRPLDDSVAREVCGREQILRRARGYAPTLVTVDGVAPGILAFGGHLKAAIALSTPGGVIVSQHLGDLDTEAARTAHAAAIDDATRLHAVCPRLAVHDLHPDYASSRCAELSGLPTVAVQHHLAHVAACLAEHRTAPPALGVAWDGTGYGPDGTVWGGEFLLVTKEGWRRVAHLRQFRLPGGEAAAREPRRAALGLLFAAFGEAALAMTDLPPVATFTPAERAVLGTMLSRGINAPLTSSAGRLFDAFAALAGLRQRANYEGQAAIELEGAADGRARGRCYPFTISEAADEEGAMIVDWQPALEQALADVRAGEGVGAVSDALHNGLATAIAALARRIGVHRVALTGGCFQNARLTAATVAALRAAGCEPLWHRRIPPNDGGIALGQAVWAGWTEHRGKLPCA